MSKREGTSGFGGEGKTVKAAKARLAKKFQGADGFRAVSIGKRGTQDVLIVYADEQDFQGEVPSRYYGYPVVLRRNRLIELRDGLAQRLRGRQGVQGVGVSKQAGKNVLVVAVNPRQFNGLVPRRYRGVGVITRALGEAQAY